MTLPPRSPDLIDRSRTEGETGAEAEQAAAAERLRAQQDAAVTKAEDGRPLIARIIGIADEARTASVAVIVAIMVVSLALVVVFTEDSALRVAIVDVFKSAILVGLGFLAGKAVAQRP